MNSDWQSWAAPAVVVLTAGVMVYRLMARKKPGCRSGCGCASGKVGAGQSSPSSTREIRYRSASAPDTAKRRSDP